MRKSKSLEKVVRIVKKNQKQNDFAYWQTQPVEKRFAKVEELRKQYHLGSHLKFEMVLRLIKRRKNTERKHS